MISGEPARRRACSFIGGAAPPVAPCGSRRVDCFLSIRPPWCSCALAARPSRRRPRRQRRAARRRRWRVASAPTAPATTHAAVRGAARRRRQGAARRGLGPFLLARASSTTGDYARGARALRARGARQGPPRRDGAGRAIADCLWMEGDRARRRASGLRAARKAPGASRTGDAALAPLPHRRGRRRSATRPPRAGSSWPSRATSRPTRWPTRRCAARRRPPRRAARAHRAPPTPVRRRAAPRELSPADRLQRAEALDQGPPLGRGAGRAGAAARRPCRPSRRRRARLPDRHDEVPHAARLRARRRAAAGRGRRASSARRRPRRRSMARGPCRASTATTRPSPATTRSSPSSRARAGRPRRSTSRAGSTTTAAASARACPGLQATLDRFGRATSPTTPPGAWRSRHFLLGDGAEALAGPGALRAPAGDGDRLRRARRAGGYWRARLQESSARDEAAAGYRELAPPRPARLLRAAGARAAEAAGRGAVRAAARKVRDGRRGAGRAGAIPTVRAPTSCSARGWTSRRAGSSSATRRTCSSARAASKALAGCSIATRAPGTSTAPTGWPRRDDGGALAAARARRGRARASGRRPTRAPSRRWSRSTARPPATPTSLYSIMRKESGSTRTTSPTPTRAASCR